MNKIFNLFFCFIFSLSFLTEDVIAMRKRHRSASGGSGLKSSVSKKKTASSSNKKSKANNNESLNKKKKTSKKTSSKNDEIEVEEENIITPEEQCLIDNIQPLLEGDCKFLYEEEVLSTLTKPFYCIYNYKDKNKIDSVYNYYLFYRYGVKEAAFKSQDSSITVYDNPKGASKYYEFLINGLKNGTLTENKILNFITEELIYEGLYFTFEEEKAINAVRIDETVISTNIIKDDIEICKEAIKSQIKNCKIKALDIKDKMEESCQEYEGVLVKDATSKKTQLFDMKADIIDVLKTRLNLVTFEEKVSKYKDLDLENNINSNEEKTSENPDENSNSEEKTESENSES